MNKEMSNRQFNRILADFAMNPVREAAYLIDEYARFYYVNDEACRILGCTRSELLGLGDVEQGATFYFTIA